MFRSRAERLRAIALRLGEQADGLNAGGEQSFLMGQAREFLHTARRFEADAAEIERDTTVVVEGRTVFIADTQTANDDDTRAGRVRLSY